MVFEVCRDVVHPWGTGDAASSHLVCQEVQVRLVFLMNHYYKTDRLSFPNDHLNYFFESDQEVKLKKTTSIILKFWNIWSQLAIAMWDLSAKYAFAIDRLKI